MITPDIINGTFEAFGSLFILNHCRVLWVTRQARGISLLSTSFFSAWGLWNIFYYPHLEQMFSFYAGLMIMAANCVWIGSIVYLRSQEPKGGAGEPRKTFSHSTSGSAQQNA